MVTTTNNMQPVFICSPYLTRTGVMHCNTSRFTLKTNSGNAALQSLQLIPGRPAWQVRCRSGNNGRYPTHFLAFWNIFSQAPFSCQPYGCQEFCTARNTRSGCGIMIEKRPFGVVRPVMPCGEPFGLSG